MIDEMQDTIDLQKGRIDKQRNMIDSLKEMVEKGISGMAELMMGQGASQEEIREALKKQYQLTDEQAKKYIENLPGK